MKENPYYQYKLAYRNKVQVGLSERTEMKDEI